MSRCCRSLAGALLCGLGLCEGMRSTAPCRCRPSCPARAPWSSRPATAATAARRRRRRRRRPRRPRRSAWKTATATRFRPWRRLWWSRNTSTSTTPCQRSRRSCPWRKRCATTGQVGCLRALKGRVEVLAVDILSVWRLPCLRALLGLEISTGSEAARCDDAKNEGTEPSGGASFGSDSVQNGFERGHAQC